MTEIPSEDYPSNEGLLSILALERRDLPTDIFVYQTTAKEQPPGVQNKPETYRWYHYRHTTLTEHEPSKCDNSLNESLDESARCLYMLPPKNHFVWLLTEAEVRADTKAKAKVEADAQSQPQSQPKAQPQPNPSLQVREARAATEWADLANGQIGEAIDQQIGQACMNPNENIRRMCSTLETLHKENPDRAKVTKKQIVCSLNLENNAKYAEWPEWPPKTST